MADNKQNLQTSEVIAKLFGVTPRRVQQLAQDKIIPVAKKRPYMFDLLPTIQTYIRYLSDKVNGREQKAADTTKAEEEKIRAEADLKIAKAKITEMQLKELEGEMHRSADVAAVMDDLVFTIRGMIMALPGRLAMDVIQASSANEASVIIRAECDKVLNELANYKYDPEEYQRRVRDRKGFAPAFDDTDE